MWLTFVISLSVCLHLHSSGLLNFCAVAMALIELGHQPRGVRLDSGDLCRQSVEVRRVFKHCAKQ